jgi:hypothetical protein
MRDLLVRSALLMMLSAYPCAAIPSNNPLLTDRIYAISPVNSTMFQVNGVAIAPAPLNGVDLEARAKIVNF